MNTRDIPRYSDSGKVNAPLFGHLSHKHSLEKSGSDKLQPILLCTGIQTMASNGRIEALNQVKRDLLGIQHNPRYKQISANSLLLTPYADAREMAMKWLDRTEPFLSTIPDDSLSSLMIYARTLVDIVDRSDRASGLSIPDAIARARGEFQNGVAPLAYELIDALGLSGSLARTLLERKAEALNEIDTAIQSARSKIEEYGKEAVKEFDFAKAEATKLSVQSAQAQFNAAARTLRWKAFVWGGLTLILFVTLGCTLWHLIAKPPSLVQDIVDSFKPGAKPFSSSASVPLLIAGSAYFTSVRLALIGVIGIGLAFSLKMTRAYLHMIEYNHHKARVTNSMEAFVAAVRTKEQKDLVLGKLIESVTEFGDSGILGNQGDGSGLPSVLFENISKNIGKTE